ncbi:MAG TPA: dihydroorotase [Saprospiraceae bacterium]|nr:dihydroorotase [Saprospiraceae bacterium]
MTFLIKNVTIVHEGSKHHLQKTDIFIHEGKIEKIGKNIKSADAEVIKGNDLYCSIGLCDIGTHSGEPGYEHRETIDSLTKAALAGGYTTLAIFPNNKPVTQSKADIKYLKDHPDRNGVEILPIGALSKDLKGVDIAEYMDMSSGGAIAFSDGMKSVQDTGLISRALQYANQVDGIIFHHPDDHYLSQGGEMHEGDMSTSLGMKGVPVIAELNLVQRDILINDYNKGTIVEHCISSERSVKAIKAAKKDGNRIMATVSYQNLLHTDEDLNDFDTNLKVAPVLRSKSDKKALIQGLNDNTIDVIVSNHTPLDEEAKNLEFTYATPGATGLETCLAATISSLSKVITIPQLIHKLTVTPRQMLKLPIPDIEVGAKANLCIFDIASSEGIITSDFKSKSNNNPYIGKDFGVKVLATIIG